jgi:hypothetical protein
MCTGAIPANEIPYPSGHTKCWFDLSKATLMTCGNSLIKAGSSSCQCHFQGMSNREEGVQSRCDCGRKGCVSRHVVMRRKNLWYNVEINWMALSIVTGIYQNSHMAQVNQGTRFNPYQYQNLDLTFSEDLRRNFKLGIFLRSFRTTDTVTKGTRVNSRYCT